MGVHDGDTDAVKGQEVSHASPLAPVAEDDSKPKKPSPPLIVKSAFSTGEWTVTLPWKPSESDARAMRLVVDARASASASLDVNAGYAVKGWGGAVTLDRLSLDVWENLPDLSQRTLLAEAKGVPLSATSDQSDWSSGVSLDLVVRDVSAAGPRGGCSSSRNFRVFWTAGRATARQIARAARRPRKKPRRRYHSRSRQSL